MVCVNIYRENLPPASEYVNHLGGAKVDIIEELKALHLNGGDVPAENGDTYHEVRDRSFNSFFHVSSACLRMPYILNFTINSMLVML